MSTITAFQVTTTTELDYRRIAQTTKYQEDTVHPLLFLVQITCLLACFCACLDSSVCSAQLIVDHTCTDITQIPESAINDAKTTLHIAYGHTSHGSQVTDGMTGLVGFANGGGLGLSLPTDIFAWNNGGTGGALDLHDGFKPGDLGNPDRYTWEEHTRDYLNDPANSDVNVIIWSWCGQASTATSNIDVYLNLMEGLIADYANVHFVFMTGHLDGGGATGLLNLANEHIRNHCITNGRILYDFADIESYDPNGLVNYMPLLANDNCDYDSDNDDIRDRNWATDWQNSHTLDVDWYSCSCAHSQPLNGNRKAYAAWWLWASLAGWSQCLPAPSGLSATADSLAGEIVLRWTDNSSATNEDSFIIQRQIDGQSWDNDYDTAPADSSGYTDSSLLPGTYHYRVVAHLDAGPCNSGPSNIATDQIVDANPPAAPSGLSATADSLDRSMSLSWVDNSDNEAEFTIQRKVGTGSWDDDYDTVSADMTSYADNSLAPETYSYRIVARNDYGASTPSNEAFDTIIDIPLSPSDLIAMGDSLAGTVSLDWTDNSVGETGFAIQRQVDSGPWDNAYDTVGADSVSYLDDNKGSAPLPAGSYNYRVVSYNANGSSNPSNESSAIITSSIPNAPSALDSELNGFDITLTWTDASDNEEGFVLERRIDSGSFTVRSDTIAGDTETFLDSNLLPPHTYTYRIKARNNFGDSGYSNETSQYVAEVSYTITLKQSVAGYSGCEDAYLDSQYPTYNYGGDLYNDVHSSPQCNFAIRFELPAEVMAKRIIEAKIGVFCWYVSSWDPDQYLRVHRIIEQWEEGTADGSYEEGSCSWSVRTGTTNWTTPGGTCDPQPLDSSLILESGHSPEFDITDLLQQWADATIDNYGVLLVNDTPVTTGIKASEYSEYGRPYLEITYTNRCPCLLIGDLNNDCKVNLNDFAVMGMYWGTGESASDIAPPPVGDNIVNILDLNALAENWLTQCN